MVENDTATEFLPQYSLPSVGGFGGVLGGNSKFLLDDTLAR